jgi:hypothetical protein
MHNSEDNLIVRSEAIVSLLRATDPSSICLNCHAGVGGLASPSVYSFDGSARTPGGDFYWMTRTFSWTGGLSTAARHGHNVVARDFNLQADPSRIYSPGGSYQAAQLSCISCHDPHGLTGQGSAGGNLPVATSGSYGEVAVSGSVRGNYRMLGDSDYIVNGFGFSSDAPVARQNEALPFGESDDSHVDYGSGMSEWCGNCHARILSSGHNSGGTGFKHPSGELARFDSQSISYYNAYIRTGDLAGTAATAYLQFTPFERGISDPQLLNPNSIQGPDAASNVMCLTCHRAHASAFPYAGRWDFTVNLLVDSHPGIGDSGATAADVINSYYGRDIASEFGPGQGSFCGKCHAAGAP